MSESKPIQYSDLVKQGTFEKFAADADMVLVHFKNLEEGIKNAVKPLGEKLKGNITNVKELKEQSDAIDKISAAEKAQINILNEKAKIAKELIDYKSKQKKADKEEADNLKKIAAEQKKANAQTKEEITLGKLRDKATKSQAGSYNELSAKLALVSIRAKQMSASHRENTATGKLVIAQQTELRNKLIALDEATNLHVRKVGHYELALGKLGKGVKGVTGILAELGAAIGLNTEVMEKFSAVGGAINKTLKEIHHIEGLNKIVKQENTVATIEQTGAEELHNASMAQSVVLKEEQTVATEVYTGWTQAEIDAQIEAIVVQNELNASMAANPIGLMVVGLLALVGVLAYFVEASDRAKLAEEERAKATDGTIVKNEKLRELYNELIIQNHEIANSIKVAAGAMSEMDEAIDNLHFENLQKFNTAMNEVKATFVENEGTWNALKTTLTGVDVEFETAKNKTKELSEEMKLQNRLGEEAIKIKEALAEKTAIETDAEKNLILQLELKKAKQDLLNQDTYQTEILILKQKADNDRKSVEDEHDRAGKIRNINTQLEIDLLELQKQHNDSLKKNEKENVEAIKTETKAVEDLGTSWENLLNTQQQTQYDSEREKFKSQFSDLFKDPEIGYDKLAQLRKDDIISEEEYHWAIHNLKEKELEEAKTKAEEEKKLSDEKTQNELDNLNKIAAAVGKGLQERIAAQIAAQQITTAAIDAELQTQATLFAAGLDNNLAYEKEERAKATEEELALARKAEKEKKAVELAQTYISFVQSYLKSGDNAQAAATKALAQTLVIEGISDAIAGNYADGIEDFKGKGTGTSDSNIIGFSNGESVVTAQGTKETSGLVSAINSDGYDGAVNWAMKNIYSPQFAASLPNDSIGGKATADYSLMLALNTTIEKGIKKGFENIDITNWSQDAVGRLIEQQIKNGVTKTINHSPDRPF